MDDTLISLIERCRQIASKRGEALVNSNSKEANKLFKELIAILPLIRSFGQDGEEALLSLIHDDNNNVACWAATHSLKYNTDKAIESLQCIAKDQSLIGFTATMVIKQWNKGELLLP